MCAIFQITFRFYFSLFENIEGANSGPVGSYVDHLDEKIESFYLMFFLKISVSSTTSSSASSDVFLLTGGVRPVEEEEEGLSLFLFS